MTVPGFDLLCFKPLLKGHIAKIQNTTIKYLPRKLLDPYTYKNFKILIHAYLDKIVENWHTHIVPYTYVVNSLSYFGLGLSTYTFILMFSSFIKYVQKYIGG